MKNMYMWLKHIMLTLKLCKFEKYYELPNLYSLTFIIEMDKIYPNGDGLTTMMWE